MTSAPLVYVPCPLVARAMARDRRAISGLVAWLVVAFVVGMVTGCQDCRYQCAPARVKSSEAFSCVCADLVSNDGGAK